MPRLSNSVGWYLFNKSAKQQTYLRQKNVNKFVHCEKFHNALSKNLYKKQLSKLHYFVHQKNDVQSSVLIPRITSVNPVYGFWTKVYVI